MNDPTPIPSPTPAPAPVVTGTPRITIDQFKTVDLRTAKVLEVTAHPKADRLWVLKIDIGEATPRTIVSGIREHYTPEQLVGRTIIAVANLEPAALRGVESAGMLLAVRDPENHVILLSVDGAIPPGVRVS